jgi:hypothetical protein
MCARRYSAPTYNLVANVWRAGNPTSNPPDLQIQCNLAYGERSSIPSLGVAIGTSFGGAMWLLCPPGTDIQDFKNGAGPDTVEVAAGTGRFYTVAWVDDAAGGFQNEHRFAELVGNSGWSVPFPTPSGSVPGPPANTFLQGVSSAAPTTVDTITYTAAPGPMGMAYCNVDPSNTLGLANDAIVGALTPVIVAGPVASLGLFNACQYFLWNHPGGPSIMTLTMAAAGVQAGIIFQLGSDLIDQTRSRTGTTGVVAISSATSATHDFERALVNYSLHLLTGGMDDPGWVQDPIGGFSFLDANGNLVFLLCENQIVPGRVQSIYNSTYVGSTYCATIVTIYK